MSQPTISLFSAAAVNADMDLASALTRVLQSNSFVLGQEVSRFEAEFAEYTGVRHCVSLANGTDALELALRAVGVAPGAQVACVANAGFYSATAIHLVGAQPLYVEVDDRTLTMAPDALRAALASRPAAVILTHLYGQLGAVGEIATLCREAGIPLIEDCAQAHGARRSGRRAGSFGDVACFSFYPTKNLGALGDGGAVVTSDDALAASVRALRQYGWSRKYEVARLCGRNSRLDELQAAVLREKLPRLDAHNNQRREIAMRYQAGFKELPLQLPSSVAEDYVAHLYVVRTPQRDALRAHLQAHGVASDVHYPIADIQQPAFEGRFAAQQLPVSVAACAAVVSLPCYPGMPGADVTAVIRAVSGFFDQDRR